MEGQNGRTEFLLDKKNFEKLRRSR